MRISFVSAFYPLRGGIAHFNALLYQALAERGHALQAITFSRQYPKILFPGKTQQEQGDVKDSYKTNAEVLLDSVNPFSWIRVGLRARSFKPDILLFKYWMSFFAPCYFVVSLVAKFRRNTKVVYIVDNLRPHEKRFGDEFLLWLATRAVDGYVVMSDAVERDLLSYLKNPKREKSPHPIYDIFGDPMPKSEARRLLGLPESAKVILFFGYIRRYKGLDILLDALSELVKEHSDLKALIAGEFYEDESAYRKKIDELKLWDYVILKSDYVPNDEVSRYFCAADCLVLPYRSATQSGIVQIAYRFERPLVVTDVGGLTEVVKNERTGIVVPEATPRAVAEGVKKFFAIRGAIDFEGEIRAERQKHSWQAFAQAIERLAARLREEQS
ncbi:MAG: glycosyltransferase [Chloroherpetonaceae bacterium]|nr:glycosyltransferase [Chloroherpetonaceae bacterium]